MDSLLARLEKTEQRPTPFWRVPGRIAYIVNHSYPFSSNGYAVRTHGIARALVEHGHSVIAITRPGLPWDLPGFDGTNFDSFHEIEGVRYLHLKEPSCIGKSQTEYLTQAVTALNEYFQLFKPSVVMAASNWENALPAAIAARELGLPFFYEVRGFWEITRASVEPAWQNTEEFRYQVKMETLLAKQVDRVFTLNSFMREELVKRGVDGAKIDLVPNGYGKLPDLSKAPTLTRQELGIKTQYVVGYVGSFAKYEGLDYLLKACIQLRKRGIDLSLLLVGSSNPIGACQPAMQCIYSEQLLEMARQKKFSDYLFLPGRVMPEKLSDYYSLIDLIVIPRIDLAVNDLVSPIKPLETAVHAKAMLLSNAKPLAKIAKACGVETFKKSDEQQLKNCIAKLLNDSDRLLKQGEQARSWVAEHRMFKTLVTPIRQKVAEHCSNKLADFIPIAEKKRSTAFNLPTDRTLRVAGVMDEFTYHSYAPECDLLQLHPGQWQQQLAEFKPDLLFIESAWKGLDDLWQTKISNAAPEILSAIKWCRDNKIPTLFWNKEDPVHFGTFIPVASQVDHVFTTDIDCIPKYKHFVGHDRVYLLPFAAQPLMHNPIEIYQRKDAVNFAGSYYLRYPERQRDFSALIESVKQFKPIDIYDRNFDNPHPHYTFPDEYKPMILGHLPFSEIDKAYKGYRYGININTIKQSQTMFARRVFELLASNTAVISNFSRGVRLFFGDLVISSDNRSEIEKRLATICNSETDYRKLRLLGLRKVMLEHTYAQRLSYIVSKLTRQTYQQILLPVIIFAKVNNAVEMKRVTQQFSDQEYKNKRLFIVAPKALHGSATQQMQYFIEEKSCIKSYYPQQKENELIGLFSPEDLYTPHYLTDLALATQYSQAPAFGKAAYYCIQDQECKLLNDGLQYHITTQLLMRCTLVRANLINTEQLTEYLVLGKQATLNLPDMLTLDEFNYCQNITSIDKQKQQEVLEKISDLNISDQGVSFVEDLAPVSQQLPANSGAGKRESTLPRLSADTLFKVLPKKSNQGNIKLTLENECILLNSTFVGDKFGYLYANKRFTRKELNLVLNSKFKLDCESSSDSENFDVKTVFVFLDNKGEKIAHSMNGAGEEHALAIPQHCKFIRWGLRIQGAVKLKIKKLTLGSHGEKPTVVVGHSPYLVLTKQYPAYDDLYRYGFLHSRVRAYKEHGLSVDVFKITNEQGEGYREFEGGDVASGDAELLDATLNTGWYKHVLVHLLDKNMWAVLEKYLDKVKVTVWVHGAEIQVWQRREFEFERMDAKEVTRQKKLSDQRVKFWRSILIEPHDNLHLVFVSQYFADEVMTDLKLDLSKGQYQIVHNFIDSDFFMYEKKSIEQRKKILSVRPYASRKYANDITVKAIIELSKKPIFKDLEFCLVGDGWLFDEITAPLKSLSNVKLIKRFMTHSEISLLHKEYGVFLTPTRMDAQGVSRDEAMSSGLVAITTNVAAIPEFVDSSCGIIVAPEDSKAMADAIERLYNQPDEFLKLSKAAAIRVRRQCGFEQTIEKEINCIR